MEVEKTETYRNGEVCGDVGDMRMSGEREWEWLHSSSYSFIKHVDIISSNSQVTAHLVLCYSEGANAYQEKEKKMKNGEDERWWRGGVKSVDEAELVMMQR